MFFRHKMNGKRMGDARSISTDKEFLLSALVSVGVRHIALFAFLWGGSPPMGSGSEADASVGPDALIVAAARSQMPAAGSSSSRKCRILLYYM